MKQVPSGTIERNVIAQLKMQVSRAQALKAAAAALTLAAVPGVAGAERSATPGRLEFPFFPRVKGRYTSESLLDIFNALTTAAHLRATLVTANIVAGRIVPVGPPESNLALRIAQADAAIEQSHIDLWQSFGATPITTTFTQSKVDPGILEARQTVQIAMYQAAVREFAELGQPTLAKWAFQAGAVEAEDRAIFRMIQALGGQTAAMPPNNKAFETDLVLYVRDGLDLFHVLGAIGGPGLVLTYPGRDAVLAAAGPMASGLTQKRPNDATSTVTFTDSGSITGERP